MASAAPGQRGDTEVRERRREKGGMVRQARQELVGAESHVPDGGHVGGRGGAGALGGVAHPRAAPDLLRSPAPIHAGSDLLPAPPPRSSRRSPTPIHAGSICSPRRRPAPPAGRRPRSTRSPSWSRIPSLEATSVTQRRNGLPTRPAARRTAVSRRSSPTVKPPRKRRWTASGSTRGGAPPPE
uniref:Predicted protein n=1 Tax=Hordeum vulgare subsp. vulgare TaxID=112509 RepID=F2D0D3_HORVV|nr:predicted protein [Hordeum vulgare subsp. vulgare]